MYGGNKLVGEGFPKHFAADIFYSLGAVPGGPAQFAAGSLKEVDGCQHHGYAANQKNKCLVDEWISHGRGFVWLDESRLLYVTEFIKKYQG